jgi:hypothetical protein
MAQKPQYAMNQQGRRIPQNQAAKTAQMGMGSRLRQAIQTRTGQTAKRTGQTGALGMLSERMSQGLTKKKKLAGQQNAIAQKGLSARMMSQRQQLQQGRQGQQGGVQSIMQRLQAQRGGGGAGGMSRFQQPANMQGRQIGGNFAEPAANMRTRRRGIVEE